MRVGSSRRPGGSRQGGKQALSEAEELVIWARFPGPRGTETQAG